MPNARDRSRRDARRSPSRGPKRRILVVCEGECTEKEYLDQFAQTCRKSLIDVQVVGDGGVPVTVVEKAQRLRAKARSDAKRASDSFLAYDEVWCAIDVDVDEHPNLNNAIETARQSGIEVAVSNPCFELWLVLHHREPPGMIHRHDVQKMLKNFISGYDKHVDYEHYNGGYEAACRRARRLDKQAEDSGAPGGNPTTGVYRLTASIARPSLATDDPTPLEAEADQPPVASDEEESAAEKPKPKRRKPK